MDYFRLINELRSNVIRPHILLLEHDGEPQGLVVGRLVEENLACRLGYKTIRLGRVRQLSIVYGGLIGCQSGECAERVMDALTKMLARREVDLVFLSHLDTSSRLFELATKRPNLLCKDYLVAPQGHWKTNLPPTKVEFLNRVKRKHRYWLNRLDRNLEKEFPGRVEFRCYKEASEANTLLKDLEIVASRTYQRQLNVGFKSGEEQRRRLTMAAEQGWLRAYVLYLNEEPCAFWLGDVYKGIFYSAMTGYLPEYEKYELGTVVFLKMIAQLCEEEVATIDYGLGDAAYKERFGDESWNEASVRIFAPSLAAVSLNVIRTSIERPALWLQSCARRSGLEQRLKSVWRRRLVKSKQVLL